MTHRSHYIATTDRYGVNFFYKLIERIKREYTYPQIKPIVYSTRGDGGLNKIVKLIDAGLITGQERVIIFADGDKDKPEVERKLNAKISAHSDKDKVKLFVFETEIEEWILKGTGRSFNPRKKASTQIPDYKKYKLPEYAQKINLKALTEKDTNFKEFLEILDP